MWSKMFPSEKRSILFWASYCIYCMALTTHDAFRGRWVGVVFGTVFLVWGVKLLDMKVRQIRRAVRTR